MTLDIWSRLPARSRSGSEGVLWQGRASIMTGVMVGQQPAPIDIAGSDRGFAVLTDQRLIIGHLSRFASRPEVWDSFQVTSIQPHLQDPRGVAFVINEIGPIDIVLVGPVDGLESLRNAASKLSRP